MPCRRLLRERGTRNPARLDPLWNYLGEQGRSIEDAEVAALERSRDETWRQLRAWERENAAVIDPV